MLKFNHLCLKPDEIDTVLYHGDCVDGYASAFACWLYNKKKGNKKKKITYIACQYQKQPPMLNDRNVLMCDFSFKYNVLTKMLKSVNKMIILDHHQSAEKDLQQVPKENKVFDMLHRHYILFLFLFYLSFQWLQDLPLTAIPPVLKNFPES
jgi:hypothetical protein